jgi:outer membrane biosynthesis protein TonB
VSLKMVAAALALSVLAGTSLFAQEQTPPPEQSEGRPSSSQDSSTQGSGDSGAPRSIRVGGNVAAANLIYQVTPVYPPIAKTAHISGTVVLHAIIGKDGTYKNCNISRGRRC